MSLQCGYPSIRWYRVTNMRISWAKKGLLGTVGQTERYLELEHQSRWDARNGCRQSKTLMNYPLLSRANEHLVTSRLKLRAAVGLLTGHTSLRAHLYKLGHTKRQECRLCGYGKEHSVNTVCDCPVLACKIYRTWAIKDLKKVREDDLCKLSGQQNAWVGPLTP
jgi:hypothetical protein